MLSERQLYRKRYLAPVAHSVMTGGSLGVRQGAIGFEIKRSASLQVTTSHAQSRVAELWDKFFIIHPKLAVERRAFLEWEEGGGGPGSFILCLLSLKMFL